ncbi:MAG: alcohol dehydrogenase catalytic domain-containing protein [Clostridiales bacterium]|jgi:L-iditol 2-dehydrogenase|nr:alcohol dehydrogenase catalytic domain-containing protein [Clostridiales bacterium]
MNIPRTMKAVVLAAYDKLEVVALPVPKPGPGEALCRIRSVAICGSDPKMIHGHYRDVHWPPFFPFVMGHEWAGEVVAIGEGVTEVSVGDRVAGEAHSGCGKCKNCLSGHYTVCLNYGKDGHDGGADKGHRHYGFFWQGANAEYNAYKVQSLHKFADHLSFDEAALCDTAGVAMHGIDLIGITPGGTTVVFGPGPIGLCAMQIAKGMGAGRTIMIGRGAKLEIARELGADVCIDFEREDPVARVLELTGGVGCDEVIECSGADDSPKKACELVKKTGSVVLTANYREDLSQIPLPLNRIVFNEIKIVGSKANPNASDKVLHFLADGTIDGKRLVTHTFPLEEYARAVEAFENRRLGAMKVVVHP